MLTDSPISQERFGELVGISQQAVSQLVQAGVLPVGAGAAQWLRAYCQRLREQAAGRLGSEIGGLDLASERAALARAQREGIEIKNAVLRGDYAAVSLLSQVLANASQAVAERFEHLPGQLRRACPELPPAAIDQVLSVIGQARNEWVRQTAALVSASLLTDPDDAEALEVEDGGDEVDRD